MPDFNFSELLPIDHHHSDTEWRFLTAEGVNVVEAAGRKFLKVSPETLTLLSKTAFHDISRNCAQFLTILRHPGTTSS
jgi:fumarate hydratase class I